MNSKGMQKVLNLTSDLFKSQRSISAYIEPDQSNMNDQGSTSNAESKEVYDLLIITDATFSMSDYLTALQTALPQIISISSLTDAFERIGLLAYRDYCDRKLVEWSGWLDQTGATSEIQPSALLQLAGSLEPIGGGDFPEALKTAFAKGYEVMRADATTLVLLYTDAPPHSAANGDKRDGSSNWMPEQKALMKQGSYGGHGHAFADWILASELLHSGPKKAQVFSFLEKNSQRYIGGYYQYLSLMTKGMCVYLEKPNPVTIAQVTVQTLLGWMDVGKAGAAENSNLKASLARFIDVKGLKTLKDEESAIAAELFDTKWVKKNTAEVEFTNDVLKKHLPKRKEPVQDFARRYATDEAYKVKVVHELSELIERDVATITLNPVFGSLWRAVCNDRTNESRDGLISAFGLQVERLKSENEKTRMKSWLEESYDYSAEVMEAIESVPVPDRYPCVLLDPTLKFTHADHAGTDDDAEANRAITDFRRDELLEIGRSCDYRILRRLGKVLTRLTFIQSADELSEHLANADDEQVTRLPVALADPLYGRKFWKVLLHLIVPGTMLAARPAALLAALALKIGVKPLVQPAIRELVPWRDRWNNLEIPETWNVSCLSLLLDADRAYRAMVTNGSEKEADATSLLTENDRELFDRLASYKMLEFNLSTDLTAQVPWTPEKTALSLGPTVTCRGCKYPRSVTMMGTNYQCGFCATEAEEWASVAAKNSHTHNRVSKEDNKDTPAIWVECSTQTCRAQYVVYNPQALSIRPRCYYCREQTNTGGKSEPAPCLECRQCKNRVIWSEAYRTTDASDFTCVACQSERKTIVDVVTTARRLSAENGTSWLIKNKDNTIQDLFGNRSLFHTISTAGTDSFCAKVHLFPSPKSLAALTIKGKPIFNTSSLHTSLLSWISNRKTESGTCSLCFNSLRKDLLRPACARTGCHQRICGPCLHAWYGLNAPGRTINIAALSCPFCRRPPAAKTLAAYGMGVHAVANLKKAVREKGRWVYAWCADCGMAKRFVERVCARGVPAELHGWKCDLCERGSKLAKLRIKMCPGCGTATEKMGGCDHMYCEVEGCGVDWCWYCGGKFDGNEIYNHMALDHGGFYGGED